jgi:hypothetical protein
MTLIHIDSFESYDPSDVAGTLHRRRSPGGGIETSFAKTGSQCLSLGYTGACAFAHPSEFNNAEAFVGFAFRTNNLTNKIICAFNSKYAQTQCALGLSSQKLAFYRGSYTLLGEGSTTLSVNTWYYVECKARVSNSISFGDVIIRLNEVTELELSAGQDTQGETDGTLRTVYLYNSTNNTNYYDDFYLCDNQGSVNNTLLGECVVECLRPNADGNSSQFDGSDGNQINNYLLVDDTYPDDTAEYVEAQNVNEKDLYAMQNLSIGAASVKGLSIVTAMQRTTPGKRYMKHVVRTNSTDYEGDEKIMSEGDWSYGDHLWETNPNTGLLWTEGDIGSVESGFKVSV